ncbi:hypothetical protein LCGC14_2307580 [marine sediment metagenome]|uniref:Uncharacterized protein n=1 Tax=marine sediment metagenome TaxID=412755 RepID=A0A0F9CLL4_9ZZZZ
MILCFNCDAETKEVMDALLRTGQYTDFASAIACAIRNLQVLHEEMASKGAVVLRGVEDAKPSADREDSRASVPARARQSQQAPKPRAATSTQAETRVDTAPDIFTLAALPEDAPMLGPHPEGEWSSGAEVPLSRWLFGQYNRLLPAKANCRALASLLREMPDGVEIKFAATRISEQAVKLCAYLQQLDQLHGFGRDDALATAFPAPGRSSKGVLRYANHFVARADASGRVSGLLTGLKLMSHFSKGGKILLLLTEAGWEFARLPSPVFDAQGSAGPQKFSEEEAEFLLGHIKANVPPEEYAYSSILQAVAAGADTPDSLGSALAEKTPKEAGRDLSNGFIASQRSGAVSRMGDIGLLARAREGVRVRYVATARGEAYLGDRE